MKVSAEPHTMPTIERGWVYTPFIDIEFYDDDFTIICKFKEISFENCQQIIDNLQRDLDIAIKIYQSSLGKANEK